MTSTPAHEQATTTLPPAVLVLDFGCEGGGETIFAHQRDGVWLYWSEGSAGGMGDEWDDPVVSWQKEPRADLGALLPDWFYFAHPMLLNPAFHDEVMACWLKSMVAARGPGAWVPEETWRAATLHWQEAILTGERLPRSKRAQG